MAEDLATPSNALVKMRWKEPYVSEGLNKKLNGLVPPGVVRGGRLTTSVVNSSVTISADPGTGDSIYSFIDSNGHQLTFRQTGNIVLDLDVGTLPGTTAYIGLEVTYSISAATVVKWRGYSQAEIDADPNIVCIGSAVVPAVAALIPASDLDDDRRRTAWQSISRYMREAAQVIKNGDFEFASSGSGDDICPHWDFRIVGALGGVTYGIVTTGTPQVGDRHLQITCVGAAGQNFDLPHEVFYQVRGGETVKVKFWIKSTLTPGPGSGGEISVRVICCDEDPSNTVQTEIIQDLSLTTAGSFPYTEVEGTFRLLDNVRWIRVSITFSDNNQNSTGYLYYDDIRMWIEQPQIDDGQVEGYGPLSDSSIVARSIDIVPPRATYSSMDSFISQILSLKRTSPDVYEMLRRPDGTDNFLLKLVQGFLEFSGMDASASAAADPRIKSTIPDNATALYILLWELDNQGAGGSNIRLYATDSSTPSNNHESFCIVINALWNGTQWSRGTAGKDSYRWDFSTDGFFGYLYPSASPALWDDTDWDSPGIERYSFSETSQNSIDLQTTFKDIINCLEGANIDKWLVIDSDLTQSGMAVPKIKGDIGEEATNTYHLLAEFESDTASRKLIRIYGRITSTSAYLYITMNAKWDDTSGASGEWVLDVSSENAVRITLSGYSNFSMNISTRYWDEGGAGGANFTTWNLAYAFDHDISNHRSSPVVQDGIIEIVDATSFTNPAWNTSVYENSLYAKNIPKVWAYVSVTGTAGSRTITVEDGFGLDSVTLDGSGRLEFDFDVNFNNFKYGVLTGGQIASSDDAIWQTAVRATSYVTIECVDASTGTPIDLDAVSTDFSMNMAVFGEHSS